MSPRRGYERQRTDYPEEVVHAHSEKLKPIHYQLLLKAAADANYAAMAEHFNLPVGTVKSKLNRARIKLSKLVAAETQEAAGYTSCG